MTELIDVLRREHVNIECLLRVLENELSLFDRGDAPDYGILRAVIEYFKDYPASCHHPKEDLIVDRLQARDPAAAEAVGDLAAEHREEAMRLDRVAEAIGNVLGDQEIPRAAVNKIMRDFIDHQRRHMAMEERVVFPAALKALHPADWADIALALADRADPFRELDLAQRLNTLRRDILEMEETAQRPGP